MSVKLELRNDKKMGKKGGWFNAVKKAFSPESKVRGDKVLILP